MWKSYIWYSLLPVLFSVVCTWTYSQSVELRSSEGPEYYLGSWCLSFTDLSVHSLLWFCQTFASLLKYLHLPKSQKIARSRRLMLNQKLSSQKSPNPCHWPLHLTLPTFPLTTQRNCFPPVPERHLSQEAWIPCFLSSSQVKFTRMVYNSIIVG